jgi:integrase
MRTPAPHLEPKISHPSTIPELPTTVTTLDGREYNVAGEIWVLPEDSDTPATVRFNWNLLTDVVVVSKSTSVMSPRAVSLLKLYILERMSAAKNTLKPTSGSGVLKAGLYFARWLSVYSDWMPVSQEFNWSDLTADMFEAWLATEYRTGRKGIFAMILRRFYSWGASLGTNHPDFSPVLASTLNAICIKGNIEGRLVESRDKKRGPLHREELSLIFEACENGLGAAQDRAITWTLLLTGIRPKQLYRLANRDLEIINGLAEGPGSNDTIAQTTYRLRISKIKQRGNATEYHFLPLSDGCARLLLDLRRPENDPNDRLFWWVGSRYLISIQHGLTSFAEDADLRSPRLPIDNPEPGGPFHERLHITARRFRYSLATDRIARRESPQNVAEMLGHSDTSCVHVYVETSPIIADDFQRATDYAIVPLIELMKGRTARSEIELPIATILAAPEGMRSESDLSVFGRGTSTHRHYQGLEHSKLVKSATRPIQRLAQSEARIKELVERARRKFPQIYPGQDFDCQVWDAIHLRERPNVSTVTSLGFTTLDSTEAHAKGCSRQPADSLPSYFADVIKSLMVISNHVSLSTNSLRLYAARHFWNFLLAQRGRHATSFKWGSLSEADLIAFEQFLGDYRTSQDRPLSPSSIHQIVRTIQVLVNFLAGYGICRHIDYIPQTPSPSIDATRTLDEKRRLAERKLPASGVLETLGSLYHRLTTAPAGEVSDWMLIIISAIVILMLTGLRVGEMLTLPFDCEVDEKSGDGGSDGDNSRRYGIRYWPEKVENEMMRIKWISPTAEPIVRACVTRIKRLTAAARARAKILESDPTRVPLPPEIASKGVLTRQELFALLGKKADSETYRKDTRRLIPRHGGMNSRYFYVQDVEAYLLWRRTPRLYTIRHDDNSVQKLSESLFIVFAMQSRSSQTSPCLLLVEPVGRSAIAHYLSRPGNLFMTYGKTEWQKRLTANPHCFRHWLICVAYRGVCRRTTFFATLVNVTFPAYWTTSISRPMNQMLTRPKSLVKDLFTSQYSCSEG